MPLVTTVGELQAHLGVPEDALIEFLKPASSGQETHGTDQFAGMNIDGASKIVD
jgi:hypothetical protein